MDPTRLTEAGDQHDASHARPPPILMGKPLLHERIRGRQETYAPNMLVQGENTLYKAVCAQAEGQRMAGPTQDRSHGGAGSRMLNCNQAPAFIRGPRPLE
jgi:hypothetical protein